MPHSWRARARARARSYSIFLFDYPCGVAGEIGSIWVSLPFIQQFYGDAAYYVMFATLGLYPIGLPVMFYHMLVQRKKALGKSGKAEKEKKKN